MRRWCIKRNCLLKCLLNITHTIPSQPPKVISAKLEPSQLDSSFIYPLENSTSTVSFYFLILSILAVESKVWALVSRLDPNKDGHSLSSGISKQFICLEPSVRRAAVFHYCSGNCGTNVTAKRCDHDLTILKGGIYKILDSEHGFPPHMG